ncbi:hypothetical protein [Cerasicoccus fimbriatus]|uniref:hypothetical protein n=1 Tax=Cerasicoccus fimbriatus TaxID=3014554 RepID=UPI0022B4187B|nr:hypothetical protein [Cerasicoccus sp. TK19100]
MKHWIWVGGWGLSSSEQQCAFAERWPEFEHTVLVPDSLCIAELVRFCREYEVERIGGYSLGAFLLLREYAQLPELPIMLLAPILDFKREALKGGRVDGRRLSVLLRWLRRDPLAALQDFYQQAGIARDASEVLPYDFDALYWGIEQLAGPGVEHWRRDNIRACVGERDHLLDAVQLQQRWPDLLILPDAGHDFKELLQEVAV